MSDDFPNLRALMAKPMPLEKVLAEVLPTLPVPDLLPVLKLAVEALHSGPPSDGKMHNSAMDAFSNAMTPEVAIYLICTVLHHEHNAFLQRSGP